MRTKKLNTKLPKLENDDKAEIIDQVDILHEVEVDDGTINLEIDTEENEELSEIEIEEAEELLKKTKKAERKLNKDKAKKEHYVDPKRFRELIIDYYKTDFLSDELAMCIHNIAHKMIYMPNFINYSWSEEMIGDAKVKCFQALNSKKYDPFKGNPFSYFSVIVYHAFVNRIKKEDKEHKMIKNYQNMVYNDLIGGTGKNIIPNEHEEQIQE